jgi:hypothetical protein
VIERKGGAGAAGRRAAMRGGRRERRCSPRGHKGRGRGGRSVVEGQRRLHHRAGREGAARQREAGGDGARRGGGSSAGHGTGRRGGADAGRDA